MRQCDWASFELRKAIFRYTNRQVSQCDWACFVVRKMPNRKAESEIRRAEFDFFEHKSLTVSGLRNPNENRVFRPILSVAEKKRVVLAIVCKDNYTFPLPSLPATPPFATRHSSLHSTHTAAHIPHPSPGWRERCVYIVLSAIDTTQRVMGKNGGQSEIPPIDTTRRNDVAALTARKGVKTP